ncbi:MAG: 50S ribosomal protein L30 [Deltaproteobacteria bacterium RIFCSPLOWO2_12_FULL_40_28]|nr:MAG: 50S ribosomal protein L30 [Deltaproteobacteria bacterium RIFCSPHIGHO2_02_FULL_40_28]OGQ18991.1 MAG: 50S ribosomal protein L30 [Deltaproteobacteria bacterium RIFCSPHIGHO2_12_FULL_40_32]OGQ39534.1 MAG: 50S ribosomal protein L30 [Deltaproteobacteria bacterium RIFCSPLOWO2_02_FULL_40_36]OGQ53424.1 MAG: 50S ribosomal protein L30 [Deltaproteobacteria bacterium RIFCSPLOWO2_12_FULL_40_28]
MTEKKIKVKMIHSIAGTSKRQRQTVKGLGLKKINQVRELLDSPAIRGMVKKVSHLVTIL